jgi:DNA-binding response OmpR family regulator
MNDLTGLCVLIVEDEPVIALDLASIFQDAGAEVIGPARTLREADALCSDERMAIAVLDVRLGEDTINSVAAKLASRGVALVFHTAHGTMNSLLAEWPQSQVLSKPASPEVLVKALLAALSRNE